MKTELELVRSANDHEPFVVISAPAGKAEGTAGTSTESLVVGESYDMEIDIDEPLLMRENVWTTDERTYRLASDGRTNTFVGLVDSLDDDGLVYFRLGPDLLVMIEVEPVPQPGEWLRLEVPCSSTRLFLT